MGPDFSPKTPVKSLTPQQIVRIHQLFRQAKFDDPSGDVRCSLLFNWDAYTENKLINIVDLLLFLFWLFLVFNSLKVS